MAAIVDEGIMFLTKALVIDPHYSEAMVTMSDLWRVRAQMEDDDAIYERDLATADEWLLKTGKPIRLGVEYQSANLVEAVEPTYPPLAKQARVQGKVHLDVTVGKDGHVLNVQLIAGHPLLTAAALAAVKAEVYRPFFLRGQAVEVVTDVLVEFTLLS